MTAAREHMAPHDVADPFGGEPPPGWYASIAAQIGHLAEHASGPPKPRIPWEACHPVPVNGQIQGTAGTLQQPDMYGPKDPYWWDLRDLAFWGFTSGTVTVFLNSPAGYQIAQATAPGEFTWSSNHLLGPRDQLIFVTSGMALATGSGGVSFSGQAVEIAAPWLPEYLM